MSQIKEKKEKEESEKGQILKDEQDALLLQRQKLFEEMHFYERDKDLKREAFDIANRMLKEEKLKRQEEEQKIKSLDRINYFPFTHGDMIDK